MLNKLGFNYLTTIMGIHCTVWVVEVDPDQVVLRVDADDDSNRAAIVYINSFAGSFASLETADVLITNTLRSGNYETPNRKVRF